MSFNSSNKSGNPSYAGAVHNSKPKFKTAIVDDDGEGDFVDVVDKKDDPYMTKREPELDGVD